MRRDPAQRLTQHTEFLVGPLVLALGLPTAGAGANKTGQVGLQPLRQSSQVVVPVDRARRGRLVGAQAQILGQPRQAIAIVQPGRLAVGALLEILPGPRQVLLQVDLRPGLVQVAQCLADCHAVDPGCRRAVADFLQPGAEVDEESPVFGRPGAKGFDRRVFGPPVPEWEGRFFVRLCPAHDCASHPASAWLTDCMAVS